MVLSISLKALGLGLLPLVSGSVVPYYFQRAPVTRRGLSVEQVQQELGSIVSNTSTISGPGSLQYVNATNSYNTHALPDIWVVVRPGQESDVSAIYQLLAVNRGHDLEAWSGTFSGLQIDMMALTNVTTQADGQTALLQDGAFDGQVTDYLYENGYVATTGACDCVGLLGAGLGSGHRRWEGFHGIVSRQLRVVHLLLANGTEIKVDSDNQSELLATAGLQIYNITAEKQIYDLFTEKVAEYPGLKGGHVVHEGCSIKDVRDVDKDSSTFPLRYDYLLMFFDTTIDDPSLKEPTKQWAAETRDLWNAGQPGRKPSIYVNYSLGDESLESTYSYEPW
ncbi:FAD binding domain-containing protein [Seiridium cupressi]